MHALRTLVALALVAVIAVLGYNYWSGYGWTLSPPSNTAGIDMERARQRGTEIASTAAEKAGEAAADAERAISSGTLTAKIKSKMALDDWVKARTIDVDTEGSVVTLRGVVESFSERQRAVRLAEETEGVTRVVDRLELRRPAQP